MANEVSDFAVKMQLGSGSPLTYADVAGVVSLDFPEISNPAISVKPLNSATVYVSGGSVDISEFGAKIVYDQTQALVFINAVKATTALHFKFVFPNGDEWLFDGFVTSFQPEGTEGENPKVLQANIKVQPSTIPTIS